MAEVTEKLFFRGTPAHFHAVLEEYCLDARLAGWSPLFEVISPTEEVIIPAPAAAPTDGNSIMDAVNRLRAGVESRHQIVALRPDSYRAEILFHYSSMASCLITALLCPDNRSRITIRAKEKEWIVIERAWDMAVGYIDSLGFLEDGEAVNQAKLLEPVAWLNEFSRLGLLKGSPEWWDKLEEWTRLYWTRNGRTSLPVSGTGAITLCGITSYSRQEIYRKTSLGEEQETRGDTR